MRAYLIDPKAKTITEVEHNGDYKEIYKFLGADYFDVVGISSNGDCVYIDDAGLLKDPEFFFEIGRQTLAGNGLVLGTDDEGESTSPKITLEELTDRVTFSRKRVDGFENIPEGTTEHHPIFGKVHVVGSHVRLSDRE